MSQAHIRAGFFLFFVRSCFFFAFNPRVGLEFDFMKLFVMLGADVVVKGRVTINGEARSSVRMDTIDRGRGTASGFECCGDSYFLLHHSMGGSWMDIPSGSKLYGIIHDFIRVRIGVGRKPVLVAKVFVYPPPRDDTPSGCSLVSVDTRAPCGLVRYMLATAIGDRVAFVPDFHFVGNRVTESGYRRIVLGGVGGSACRLSAVPNGQRNDHEPGDSGAFARDHVESSDSVPSGSSVDRLDLESESESTPESSWREESEAGSWSE
jgi:hypothetical protein